MNINLTLIGQMIAFICFVVFCMKYVWPPIIAAMSEREQKIADGLAAADRASHDLELAKEKAVERLKEAKEEASSIIDSANKRAGQLVEEAKDAAVVEADRVKASAQAEIEQETNRAREQLRGQVAALSLAGAEKVLGSAIDQEAHNELVEKLASEL
ncbi:F0F1 ATP synthase subunit B [Halieaceae bacterium IMCC8485]|uniref:ATP synthase subunit b n=1 Tax=Candidatus Seongchinamella marina TaxID=2518990 RepID=A0ABT3SWH1_9GAMM|nr:F0F1 ATP synthase subunit B [Candidatus Seongchinamella marina]MBT3410376.1 F0F1 ATP synthase subunit B [Halieaceae bacterium]MBT6125064.1 F0F1 ATP synthase subunit B [Halieaceae bacterium]MCX2973652.1 F0F1 ATP synthase subunit B [Candidatus Seongchinamella marina]